MRRKLIIGVILLVGSMLLTEVSYIADIWIIRALSGVISPVGIWMTISALASLTNKKESNDSPHQSTEND